MNRKNIIISPSGKLYGSEYVLLDFLRGSTNSYDVYVPKHSVFYNKLKEEGFNVYGFTNLKKLYFSIFFKMLISSKNLYLNEGGHISYVKLLAKILPKRKFVVVLRLLEDCNDKLHRLTDNIRLVAVSNFIKKNIISNNNSIVVYDPYQLKHKKKSIINKNKNTILKIGVVGRIIETKGIGVLPKIINDLPIEDRSKIKLNFFGSFDENSNWFIVFKNELSEIEGLNFSFVGFIKNQDEIYQKCDLILHLNKFEALGRIIFEAIDYNIPFLCFKEGGSGELAYKLDLTSQIASDENDMTLKLKNYIFSQIFDEKFYNKAKNLIKENFKHTKYANKLECLL